MTLFEILIAVLILSLCAYTIMETVLTADVQSTYAMHRSLVVSALQDKIEAARGLAASGALTSYSSGSSVSLPGFVAPVTVTATSTLEATSRTLFDVTATATWTETSSLGTYTDTASLATIVRQ